MRDTPISHNQNVSKRHCKAHLCSQRLYPHPVILVFQGFYQGVLTQARFTHRITEAVFLYFLIALIILAIGVAWNRVAGIYVGTVAMVVGALLQTVWMRQRSISDMKKVA
ncbi:MAG: hypothetical protein O3B43_05265 [Chloroflexi bacterium]|nr:hypothetical protein [Chloroflexota bacterium]